jgi:hypothetical protein
MMFRAVFWIILPCKMIVDKHFTRQYNPEDSSEHHLNVNSKKFKCTLLDGSRGLHISEPTVRISHTFREQRTLMS